MRGPAAASRVGGALARWMGWVVCARAPGLTSVRDPAVRRVGDVMFDGVIPLGEALRPLVLSRPSTVRCRQRNTGSWPRQICVSEDSARTEQELCSGGLQGVLAELAQRVVAALQELARDREARSITADPLGGLEVVVAVGAAWVTRDLRGFVQRPPERRWSLTGEMAGRATLV